MIKAVIFDFDGTIADSFNIFVETLSEVLKREPLTADETEKLRGSSISEILKYLKVNKFQTTKLIVKGRREIAKKMNRVEIFKGMDDVIKDLSNKNFKIYILSSNSIVSIRTFLDRHKITPYIQNIYGGISITGKAGHLKQLLKKENIALDDAIYIGDEVRDAQATQKIGMRCVSVTWGYSTKQSLEVNNPGQLVSKPAELIKQLKS